MTTGPNQTATDQASAPAGRVVRVFVSSTFRDMHAERDHLVTVVFPELRDRLESLGLELYDVDLRWGVPEKGADAERANSWEYCRKWIDRVEPFFIALLGQRYGHVPPPTEIPDQQERQAYRDLSITEMEIRHAVLSGLLQRRSFFYLREDRVPDDTDPVVRAVFVEDEPRVEELKRRIAVSGRPVRHYRASWNGRGFTDLEAFGEAVLEDLWSGVLRDARFTSQEVWRKALGRVPALDSRYADDSAPVPAALAAELTALARPVPASDLESDRRKMEAFANARLRWFRGRSAELWRLEDFVNRERSEGSAEARVAVVHGASGTGKSALMGAFWRRLQSSPHLTIAHFVGATERSSDARSIVERMLDELDANGVPGAGQSNRLPDFSSMCARLADVLGTWSGERRIVILIDGLNQLSEGHDLRWLPRSVGPAVRLVISYADAGESGAGVDSAERVRVALAARDLQPWRLELGPLTAADVRSIVVEYLAEYCKELDSRHVERICAIPQAANPLFLLVLLGELRTLGGEDMNRTVPGIIAGLPASRPDSVSLFDWVLERLEVFGADAVRLWCVYLALGRAGMASQELASLLAARLGPEHVRTARRIERGIRRFLQRRGPQIDFFHSDLREAAVRRYMPEDRGPFHRDIAACLGGLWRLGNRHALSELPFHLLEGGQSAALFRLARRKAFLDAQSSAFPREAGLILWTIQAAIRAASRERRAGEMAEFAFSHARRVSAFIRQPLDALRGGSLEEAWRLAELNDARRCALWLLLIAWALGEEGRKREAAETLRRLLNRGPAPVESRDCESWARECEVGEWNLARGEWNLVVALLAHAATADPDLCAELTRTLLSDPGRREFGQRIRHEVVELARKGELSRAAALSQVIESPWVRAQALAHVALAGGGAQLLAQAYELAGTPPADDSWTETIARDQAFAAIASVQLQTGDVAAAHVSCAAISDPLIRASALQAIAADKSRRGDANAARMSLEQAALAALEAKRATFFRVPALCQLAVEQLRSGTREASAQTLEKALAEARSSDSDHTRVQVLIQVAEAQFEILGREQASALLAEAARTILADPPPDGYLAAVLVRGLAHVGDFGEALQVVRLMDPQNPYLVPAATTAAEAVAAARGWPEALRASLEHSSAQYQALVLAAIAEKSWAGGDQATAREALEKAHASVRGAGPYLQARSLRAIAKAHAAMGESRAALAALDEGVRAVLAMDQGGRELQFLGLMEAQFRLGERRSALQTCALLLGDVPAEETYSDPAAGWGRIAALQAKTGDKAAAVETVRAAMCVARRSGCSDPLFPLAAELVKYGEPSLAEVVYAVLLRSALRGRRRKAWRMTDLGRLGESMACAGFRGLAERAFTEAERISMSALRQDVGMDDREYLAGCRANSDPAKALEIARRIQYADRQSRGLCHVADALARQGQKTAAREVFEESYVAALRIRSSQIRSIALKDSALAQARTGDFEMPLKRCQEIPEESIRQSALAGVAELQAAAGDVAGAAAIRERLPAGGEEWLKVQAAIAAAHAKAGDFASAMASVAGIESSRHSLDSARSTALAAIAAARAKRGEFDEALSAAREIPFSYDRAAAITNVCEAQAKEGRFSEALAVAGEYLDPAERSEALASIAECQIRAGLGAQAVGAVLGILEERTRCLLQVLSAASETRDAASFCELFIMIAHDRNSLPEACAELAALYPEQAGAVAKELIARVRA